MNGGRKERKQREYEQFAIIEEKGYNMTAQTTTKKKVSEHAKYTRLKDKQRCTIQTPMLNTCRLQSYLHTERGKNPSSTCVGSVPVRCDTPMPRAVPTKLAAMDCDAILAVRSPRFCRIKKLCPRVG
jgi:hypothetical protein